ncbi:MAG: SpoIID/LytB domain-containing protein [Firmicutes bacterium]|nr:SpoIID/LytB domain-containing protein [Bacillota bacterium]
MRRRYYILVAMATIISLIGSVIVFPSTGLAEDVVYTISGAGWGHGLGMCQWGAQGRALSGQNYQQILAAYYQNTQLTGYPVPTEIRVLLFGGANLPQTYIEGEGGAAFSFQNNGVPIEGATGVTGRWMVAARGDGLAQLRRPDGSIVADGLLGPVIVTGAGENLIVYNSAGVRYHAYKGSIWIYPNSGYLYLVNHVGFDPDYLNGLGEMPSSWNIEALKAQAVAARSYAIACMRPSATYDLYDSVSSQVYVGVDKVNGPYGANWASAVSQTTGQVLIYGGKVIAAYYHSSCGGHTENSENVWSSALGYIRGVSDINPATGRAYCDQPGNTIFRWSVQKSKSDLESRLGIPGITGLTITGRGVSPRVTQLVISKADGSTVTMKGSDFRSRLGLNSTWIDGINLPQIIQLSRPVQPDVFLITIATNKRTAYSKQRGLARYGYQFSRLSNGRLQARTTNEAVARNIVSVCVRLKTKAYVTKITASGAYDVTSSFQPPKKTKAKVTRSKKTTKVSARTVKKVVKSKARVRRVAVRKRR